MSMDVSNKNIRNPSSEAPLVDGGSGFNSTSQPLRLYDDRHPWPLRCPHCSAKFVEQIKRLSRRNVIRCPLPECHSVVEPDPNFPAALSRARSGSYDPFEHVWKRSAR